MSACYSFTSNRIPRIMGAAGGLLALTLVLTGCSSSQDAEPVLPVNPESTTLEISQEVFPDTVYRTYIGQTADTDADGFLTPEEISQVTKQDLHATNVLDLTGIDIFTNLQTLNCSDTDLTTLPISANKQMKYLNFSQTSIEALDITELTHIESLLCDPEVVITGMPEGLKTNDLVLTADIAETDTFNPNAHLSVTYDALGRMTQAVVDDDTIDFTYDKKGRVDTAGSIVYRYADNAIERANESTKKGDDNYFPYTYTYVELSKEGKILKENTVVDGGMLGWGSVPQQGNRSTTCTYDKEGILTQQDCYVENTTRDNEYAYHVTTEYSYPQELLSKATLVQTYSYTPKPITTVVDAYTKDNSLYVTTHTEHGGDSRDVSDVTAFNEDGFATSTTMNYQDSTAEQRVAYECNADGYVTHATWSSVNPDTLVNRDMSITYVKHITSSETRDLLALAPHFLLVDDQGYDRNIMLWEPTNGGVHGVSFVYSDPIEKAKLRSGMIHTAFINGYTFNQDNSSTK